MSNEGRDDMKAIIRATSGILFFGCPNRGMDIKYLIRMCEGQVNLPFLVSLRQESDCLRRLSRDFPGVFKDSSPRIMSFFETKVSPTEEKVSGQSSLWRESQMETKDH